MHGYQFGFKSHSKWSNARYLRTQTTMILPTIHGTFHIFVAASHQTRLDTRSKARRPINVGIKGRGRSGTNRDSNPACLCCSSAHLVQCEPDEASGFIHGTFHDLNCFSHMIYVPHTSMYQNIAKPLTPASNIYFDKMYFDSDNDICFDKSISIAIMIFALIKVFQWW